MILAQVQAGYGTEMCALSAPSCSVVCSPVLMSWPKRKGLPESGPGVLWAANIQSSIDSRAANHSDGVSQGGHDGSR
eukprot:scaffold293493_cov26-Tisochrysis_lutea.AAC.1